MKNRQGSLQRFRHGEAGGGIVFAIFFIVMMLAVVGYAVDVTRFENRRAMLQATLDRAVLAAASLSQALPCEDVVRDYFDKAGLGDALDNVACTENDMGRTVEVSADMELNTLLMSGVESLSAPSSGTAVETVNDIEIVLVLDITGSMQGFNKIVYLKAAAQSFVSEVLERDRDNRVSIAIVPFGDQVNISPWLINAYQGVYARQAAFPLNHCINLPDSVWSSTAIRPVQVMPQMGSWSDLGTHVLDWYQNPDPQATTLARYGTRLQSRCPSARFAHQRDSMLSLPSQNADAMNRKIAGMMTSGASTTIQTGMKWGLALLDPSMRPIYDRAIAEGQMPSTLAGRPYDFGRDRTLKIIIVMSDGANGSYQVLRNDLHSGPSPIYRGADGNYAIHHPNWAGPNDFYTPHTDNAVNATPPRTGTGLQPPPITPTTPIHDGWWPTPEWPGSGVVTRLDWMEVWQSLSVGWMAWQFHSRPLGNNNLPRMMDIFYQYASTGVTPWVTVVSTETADAWTTQTCNLAKDNGVIVFSVAYMAGAAGEAVLRDCATSIAHYYAPVGSEISDAFDSIANQISMLRLTR